MNKTGKV
jgi:predicted thioredoxin/glutaredoxin